MSLTLTRRHNVDRFGYLIPTRYGNVPMVGAVATYRPGEGRFGGAAVAVEEGTTNLIPSNSLKFEGWIAHRGTYVTVEQGHSIPGITPDGATRIQTSGGTELVKYVISVGPGDAGTPASYRVWVRNIGDKPVRVFGNVVNVPNIVYPGETKLCTGSRDAVDGIVFRQIQFQALDVDDSLDLIAYQPQIEEKPFPTSFVDGTRETGKLVYPVGLPSNQGTVVIWAKKLALNTGQLRKILDGESPRIDFQWRDNDEQDLYLEFGGARIIVKPDPAMDTDWHQYAIVYSGLTVSLYFDGELVGTGQAMEPLVNFSNLYVGARYENFQYPGNALYSELLILPYTASDEEIRAWYEADGPLPPHPDALLQWDWQAVRPATMVAL